MWSPERDPTANPSNNGTLGFWGPWRSSTANKIILNNVLDSIPSVSGKKPSFHTNGNGKKIGKEFSTHEESDKDVYLMLENILRMTKKGKKGQIPRNSKLMKESLAMLYAKMKKKTKVDDLMHKLQMIKKGRVAKRKGHKPVKLVKEQTRSSTLTQMNSSLKSHKPKKLITKNHQTIDKTGTRRTEIENVPIRDDTSLNNGADNIMRSNPREDDQDMEEALSLDTSSGSEQVEQNDPENGELMADNSENDRNRVTRIEDEYDSEVESSGQSAVTNSLHQTSGRKSEMEFEGSDSISDDIDNNDDDDNGSDDDYVNDDNGNDNGNDDFIEDNNRNSGMYL